MKRWRVGTLSMGLSLILIGVTLLISTWNGEAAFETMIRWWPIVFIMLGAEIVIYLFVKRKEQPLLHYDVFSILFVGFICCVCVGFALAAASGLTNEIRYAIGSVERTLDIPQLDQPVSAEVKQIVIQTSGAVPKIDRIAGRELHLFGQYRVRQQEEREGKSSRLAADDIASIRTVGQTLYITIKQLPQRVGFNESYPYAALTVALPQELPFELRGSSNQKLDMQQQ